MTMAKARNWRDVRADGVRTGAITEDGVAEAGRRHDERVRAYRLAQVRKDRSVNQTELADLMEVSQSRVSKLERGDIEHTELATLRSYVEALGGRIRVVADFDEEEMTVA